MTTPERRDSNYAQPFSEKDVGGIPIPSFILPILTYFLPKEIRSAHRSYHVERFIGGEYSHAMVLLLVSFLTVISTAGNCVVLLMFAKTAVQEVSVGLVYVGTNLVLIGGLYLFRHGVCSSLFFANLYTLAAFIN